MVDKLIGVSAILLLVAFMAVLVVFVPDIDLILVVGIVSAMAAYDFYLTLFKSRSGKAGR